MTAQAQQIMEKLNHIQLDLNFIKEHINDVDVVLMENDIEALQKAEEDLKAGKTTRLA